MRLFASPRHAHAVDEARRTLFCRSVPRVIFHSMRVALCLAVASILLLLVSSPLLRAQCGPEARDLCQDSCCHTDALLLNTGYNHAANGVYSPGNQDNYWTIIAGGAPAAPPARPANVVNADPNWAAPFPNSQWINGGGNTTTTFEKCFCVCDSTELTFSMNILVTGKTEIYVDNVNVASVNTSGPKVSDTVSFTISVGPGRHCLEIEVEGNGATPIGLNLQGTVQGSELLKYNCCAAAPGPRNECDTNRVTYGSDNTWTLLSQPAACPGATPRCATVMPGGHPAGGPPITGTSWIGPNAGGNSCANPCPQLYTYRKSFCVAEAGTFIITISGMADDSGVVDLNGVPLFPAGTLFNRLTPTTRTYIVALTAGCHCLDFRVFDLGCAITALDALIDIQGGRLLKPNCCDCDDCAVPPPPLPPPGGGDGNELLGIQAPNDPAAEARPMLLSIPNPTTGETTVHYMLDKEAPARVELYNAAGKRVMVVDEGVRAKGAHAVPLVTNGLAKGAYHLRLVYGNHTLSVPLNVQ